MTRLPPESTIPPEAAFGREVPARRGQARGARHPGLRAALVALEALMAVTSIWGALSILPTLPLAWLHQGHITPFVDYTVPALALGVLCGGSALVALAAAVTSPRVGALASIVCGALMIGFELVEIAVVGLTAALMPTEPVGWLQVVYLVVGAAVVALGVALWHADTGSFSPAGLRQMWVASPTGSVGPVLPQPRLAGASWWLSLLVLALMPLAAGIGLFVPGFYRDTGWTIPQARGQDLVSLVVAEPLLVATMIATRTLGRGSFVARLLWAGALSYVLYTYALYCYTTYFNALFLGYVALFSASLFALIDLLTHLDLAPLRRLRRPASAAIPVRPVAAFLAFIGVFFLLAWLAQIVPATLHGTVPSSVALAKTPTNAVFVQDLAVVIPLCLVAAVWLWQRRNWGYVLGALLLVLTDLIAVALVAMSLFSAQARIAGALDLIWGFVVLALVSLALTVFFALKLHRLG